jgi:thioredoxin-related protein
LLVVDDAIASPPPRALHLGRKRHQRMSVYLRHATLAALIALIVVPQALAGTFVTSVSAAQKKAKAKNQLIFVDLFAEWCGWCHKFEKEVVPSEVFQKATDDMVLLRLDTDDRGEGTEFARRYQIGTLPTFLVLNSELTIAGVMRGYAPPTQFARMLEQTITKYENFQKTVKQEASFAKDYPKRLEIAREFLQRQAYSESEPRLKKLTAEKGVPLAFRDEAYYQLAVLYLMQGRYEDTVKTINEFAKVQKEGEFFERSRLLRGDVFLQQGNLAGAAEVYRDFKERFPNSPLVQNVNMTLPMIERQLNRQ